MNEFDMTFELSRNKCIYSKLFNIEVEIRINKILLQTWNKLRYMFVYRTAHKMKRYYCN